MRAGKGVRAPIPFRPRDSLKNGGRPMKVTDRQPATSAIRRMLGIGGAAHKESTAPGIIAPKSAPATATNGQASEKSKVAPTAPVVPTGTGSNSGPAKAAAPTVHPWLSGLNVYVDSSSAAAFLSRPAVPEPPRQVVTASTPPPPQKTTSTQAATVVADGHTSTEVRHTSQGACGADRHGAPFGARIQGCAKGKINSAKHVATEYWPDFISLIVIICCWLMFCLCCMYWICQDLSEKSVVVVP